jgi:hypothetical protein
MSADVRNILESAAGYTIGIFFIEALVKPAVRFYGRKIFAWLDLKVKWIPDFLSKKDG